MKKAISIIMILTILSMTILIAGCIPNKNGVPVPINLSAAQLGVANTDTMSIPTDISCTTEQDCIDYALSQDPTAHNVHATCDQTCTFITDKTPTVEVTP